MFKKIMDEIIPNDDIDSVKEIICAFNFEGNKYNYLYSAYINKRHDVFKYLVKEKDVSLFGENDFNTNLTYQIIDDDCIELFEYILLNSKEIINNIDIFDNDNNFNLLLYSCFNSKLSFVKMLVKNGANVNISNREGIFPLYDACKVNNINIVKFLIDNGALLYKSNVYNMSSLGVAFIKNSDECLEFLIDKINDFSKISDYTVVLLGLIIKDNYNLFKKMLSKISIKEIIIQKTLVTESLNITNMKLIDFVKNLTSIGKISSIYIETLINFECDRELLEIPELKTDELVLKVVGVTYNNRQENIKKLSISDEVFLIMEPDNLYDSNAVLVMDKYHNELGYISREDNKMIFERLVQNQRYVSCVYSLPSSNFYETIGVNIKISFFKEF